MKDKIFELDKDRHLETDGVHRTLDEVLKDMEKDSKGKKFARDE